MNGAAIGRALVLAVCFLSPTLLVGSWTQSAGERLARTQAAEEDDDQEVAVASAADKEYCDPKLKKILRRVLRSCGLLNEGDSGRGCAPADARTVATMSGDDFNALFRPMRERGGIIQFDQDSSDLDTDAQRLLDEIFSNQRGASYFFVVARASTEGAAEYNQKLSKKRANSIMSYLQENYDDPRLKEEVGLLWLGEEYAQLEKNFCEWRRSRSGDCSKKKLNRSAFIAWIDCTL